MASTPTLELPFQPAADVVQEADPADVVREAAPAGGGAVASLGTWMAILGAVRLAGEVVAYAGLYREAQVSGLIAARGWGWFLGVHSPVFLPIEAWPLILGLALRRTRRRELIRAGSLTFLVLSIGGLLTAVADWTPGAGHEIAIGSFRVPKMDWGRLPAIEKAMVLAGASQLLLELLTGVYAFALATRGDGEGPLADRLAAARRTRLGRLALGVSFAFLVMTIRVPAWSGFVELLSQSKWIREFIMRDDIARLRAARRVPSPESAWAAQARTWLDQGEEAWAAGHYGESVEKYSHLAGLLDAVPTAGMSPAERRLAARSLNNWAWLLATCPEVGLRNHADSVKYARRALELEPNDGSTWNTLGVGYFRLEDWDDAMSALYRSMELRDEGDSSDWFFLAMIHQRLGHKERALQWYNQAVRWAHAAAPGNEELYRFEVEAAELLGLPRPEKLAAPARQRVNSRPYSPRSLPRHRGRMGSRMPGIRGRTPTAGPPANDTRRGRPL